MTEANMISIREHIRDLHDSIRQYSAQAILCRYVYDYRFDHKRRLEEDMYDQLHQVEELMNRADCDHADIYHLRSIADTLSTILSYMNSHHNDYYRM